jgi:hypothetical protein
MKRYCAEHPKDVIKPAALVKIYGPTTKFYRCLICDAIYMRNFHNKLILIPLPASKLQ